MCNACGELPSRSPAPLRISDSIAAARAAAQMASPCARLFSLLTLANIAEPHTLRPGATTQGRGVAAAPCSFPTLRAAAEGRVTADALHARGYSARIEDRSDRASDVDHQRTLPPRTAHRRNARPQDRPDCPPSSATASSRSRREILAMWGTKTCARRRRDAEVRAAFSLQQTLWDVGRLLRALESRAAPATDALPLTPRRHVRSWSS